MNKEMLLAQKNSGISWFYWITGLSLINTWTLLFWGSYNFVVWLGATQILDGTALSFYSDGNTMAMGIILSISVLVSGFFSLAGYMAQSERRWWYLAAMLMYALDTLIFLLADDYVWLWFHIFALVFIGRWYMAYRKLSEENNSELLILPDNGDAEV